MYERFKRGMNAKQERVDSLNYGDTVFLSPMYLSFLQPNKVVLFTEAAPVSTPCCLPSLLVTANQISQLGEAPYGSRVYRRKKRVYGQYTQQDNLMGNTEQILQYYKKVL